MKFEKTIVQKILGGVLRRRKQSFFDRQIMHPRRDWLVGFIGGLLMVAYAGYSSYETYQNYRSSSIDQLTDLPTDNIYREPMVKIVLEDFTLRRDLHEGLKSKLITSRRSETLLVPSDREESNSPDLEAVSEGEPELDS